MKVVESRGEVKKEGLDQVVGHLQAAGTKRSPKGKRKSHDTLDQGVKKLINHLKFPVGANERLLTADHIVRGHRESHQGHGINIGIKDLTPVHRLAVGHVADLVLLRTNQGEVEEVVQIPDQVLDQGQVQDTNINQGEDQNQTAMTATIENDPDHVNHIQGLVPETEMIKNLTVGQVLYKVSPVTIKGGRRKIIKKKLRCQQ